MGGGGILIFIGERKNKEAVERGGGNCSNYVILRGCHYEGHMFIIIIYYPPLDRESSQSNQLNFYFIPILLCRKILSPCVRVEVPHTIIHYYII